ncbi:MAG: HNH endonuclease, partial [Nitrospirae bacterium]|nr:HNH endonuclease [Nitrospirota bacterium]
TASELGLDRANTSAHLNDLVKQGEVQKARLGRDVYYSCDGSVPEPDHLKGVIEESLQLSNAFGARRCPRCGTEAGAEFLYCPRCGSSLSKNRSRIIPPEVKQAVWVRDGGKCVLCGSRANLHYDHIIPVAKGGGNTVENIQVLCADCNLKKSDRIE